MKCVSPFYVTREGVWVPCGKCNFCVARKRQHWAIRLFQELKAAETAAFVTMTYDDSSCVYDVKSRLPVLEKDHVQRFLKRLRYYEGKKRRKALRYYAVGEYGSQTLRPHYHALLFNFHPDTLGTIADVWGKGLMHVGKVEPASVMYVSGYIINKDDDQIAGRTFPFSLMSKGIGKQYLTPQVVQSHKRRKANFVVHEGVKWPMPRYYSDRVFTKMDRQVMAIEMEAKLDQRYRSELERLIALHFSPSSYYREKEIEAYKRIKVAKTTYSI